MLGRNWNVSEGESLVQPLYWEGDGTPVTVFLKGPLGEKGLICNGFDKNFSLSPSPLVCQGISAEERPHPHYTPENLQHNRDLTGQEGLPTLDSPFMCTGCGKTFRGNLGLVQHQRASVGEKSFICSECGKSISQNSVL